MIANSEDTISIARSGARKLSLIYVGVLALWVLIQSGIPMAPYVEYVVEDIVWWQTLSGWFFVLALGWLLYLLLERGLRLIAGAQEALRLRDRAIESSVNGVFIMDYLHRDGPIVYVNPAFERITGFSRGETLGRSPTFLVGSDVNQPEFEALQAAVKDGRQCRAVLRSYRKDGSMFWNEAHVAPVKSNAGNITHYVAILQDISETRRYQEELARQANYDALTNLPNRNLLSDRISHAVSRARRYERAVAVCLVGLDKFRLVNDSLGHALGNDLLRAVAARLQSRFRVVDTLARLGGDAFALVLVDEATEPVMAGEMQRILDTFSEPFAVEERELFVTASVGVALYPQDGRTAEALLKRAEIAMHRAKDQGGNTFQMFTREMDARIAERMSLENKLRRSLERNEMLLHYQPQTDLRTGRITGAEALVRWKHPELGMVPPAKFIPLAEETGLVIPIGDWVLRTACAQNRAWQQDGLRSITVSVNISARQFRQQDLADSVTAALRDTGLDPLHLELELTESIIMHDAEEVIAILQKLKAMGVKLAIDDFGTGYSSLSYLRRFPVDRLKIDQSFVRDIPADPDAAAIAQSVISLGQNLNLRVIAEGVDNSQQYTFLRERGCDEIQGYLIGRPVPAEEFKAVLEKELITPVPD